MALLQSGQVRKHRAPKGALRHGDQVVLVQGDELVRKHRAPKGALRLYADGDAGGGAAGSESTERQKVH